MALEVMSESSVRKDTDRLRELYWRAGITEYWLVDARDLQISFVILRRTAKGYVQVPKQAGWQKSTVFGKSFKLTVRDDEDGFPEYTLAVR
jgi:Uma2 family endonuclease